MTTTAAPAAQLNARTSTHITWAANSAAAKPLRLDTQTAMFGVLLILELRTRRHWTLFLDTDGTLDRTRSSDANGKPIRTNLQGVLRTLGLHDAYLAARAADPINL